MKKNNFILTFLLEECLLHLLNIDCSKCKCLSLVFWYSDFATKFEFWFCCLHITKHVEINSSFILLLFFLLLLVLVGAFCSWMFFVVVFCQYYVAEYQYTVYCHEAMNYELFLHSLFYCSPPSFHDTLFASFFSLSHLCTQNTQHHAALQWRLLHRLVYHRSRVFHQCLYHI